METTICKGSGSVPTRNMIDPLNAMAICPTCNQWQGVRVEGTRIILKRHRGIA